MRRARAGAGGVMLAFLGALSMGNVRADIDPDPTELSLEQLLRQGLAVEPRAVVVTAASRFAQSAEQAPGLTYVLAGEEIRSRGLRNLADVLRQLPGLYVTSDGISTFVGARGLGRPADLNGRLLILLDGMRLNENIYDAAPVAEDFPVDIEAIERVEFAPGPGGAMYGSNAFLGVISISTRGAGKGAGLRLHGSVDSQRGHRAGANWSRRLADGAEYGLALSVFDRRDMFVPIDEPAFQTPLARQLTWERSGKLSAFWNWEGLQLRLGMSSYNRGSPRVMGRQAEPELGQSNDVNDHGFVQLAYETQLGEGWDVGLRWSAQVLRYRNDLPFRLDTGETGRLRFQALGQWRHAEFQLGRQLDREHRLSLGVEIQDDDRQDLEFRVVGDTPLQSYQQQGHRLGLYVQDEWALAPGHRLVLGMRADRGDEAGSARWNPRLAWIWTVSERSSLRWTLGSAHREPNLYERMVNSFAELPQPRPERVRSMEFAWDHSLPSGLRYRASVYGSQLRRLIGLDDGGWAYINADPVRSVGLEFGLEQRWRGGGQFGMALSLQGSHAQSGVRLSNSPQALLKLNYRLPLNDRWSLAWQLHSVSRRLAPAGDLPGYAQQDVLLRWQMEPGWGLALGIHNLSNARVLDQTRPDSFVTRQASRSLRLGLEWQLQ